MKKIMHVDTLTVRAGKKFLIQDISFSLEEGKTLALIGESGSGKTTTAHAIGGLLAKKPFSISGSILFDNKDLTQISEKEFRLIRGKKLSMIFQDPSASLHPLFSIGRQVAEMFEAHLDMDEEEARQHAQEVLKEACLAKISNIFETYPHQLSGGMKQRVMIAMALCLGPQVLIADEPTSALDLTVQKEILELLKSWQERCAISLLLITHDFTALSFLADTVAVLYASYIVETASKEELFSDPLHPYTQELLSSLPSKENRKKPLKTISGSWSSVGCPFHPSCPFAMEKCRSGKVPIFTKTATHSVRCWLYEDLNACT
jgi:peptide/nickel transport system ATP-binding protein